MAKEEQIKTSIELTGEQAYRNACKEINGSLKVLGSEMRLTTAEYSNNAQSTEALQKKQEILKKTLDEQSKKVQAAETALKQMKDAGVDPADASYQKMQTTLNNAKTEMAKTKSEIENTSTALKNSKNHWSDVADAAKKAGEVLGASVLALGAAAAAAGKAIWDSANDVAAAGDEIDKESQKLQISSDLYQELEYACGRSGTSIDSLRKGIINITGDLADAQNGVKGATKDFDAIGVSLTNADGSFKSTEDVLLDTIDALANMEDETQRNAAAQDIFGKSYSELLPLLNSGGDGIKELMQEAQDYGMVMSTDTVAASAAFEDSLLRLKNTFGGLKNSIVGEVLPSITQLMDGFADLLAGNEGASEGIKQGMQGVLDSVAGMIPQVVELVTTLAASVLEVAPSIMQALITGILDNLPLVLATASDVMLQLLTGMLDMLPEILDAGCEVIATLINGIADALPTLIPEMVEVMLQMVTTLIDNMPMLIQAALQLMIGLATGIIQALPNVVQRMPEIITAIVNALIGCIDQIILAGVQLLIALVQNLPEIIAAIIQAAPQIVDALVDAFAQLSDKVIDIGVNLLKGIWEGMKNTASWLWDQVHEWANSFIEDVEDFFGIESPSKVFAGIGGYMAQGLGVGFNKEMKDVEKSMLAETAKVVPELSLTDSYKSGKGATIVNHNVFTMDGKPFYESVNTQLGLMY